jgi:hypothetical protein
LASRRRRSRCVRATAQGPRPGPALRPGCRSSARTRPTCAGWVRRRAPALRHGPRPARPAPGTARAPAYARGRARLPIVCAHSSNMRWVGIALVVRAPPACKPRLVPPLQLAPPLPTGRMMDEPLWQPACRGGRRPDHQAPGRPASGGGPVACASEHLPRPCATHGTHDGRVDSGDCQARSVGTASGNDTRNVVPALPVASTSRVPPCAATRWRAMARPRPEPVEPEPLTKRSKT